MTFLCLAGLELVIIDEDLLKEANLVSLSFGIRIHKTNWTSCGPLKGKIEGGRLDVIYQELLLPKGLLFCCCCIAAHDWLPCHTII